MANVPPAVPFAAAGAAPLPPAVPVVAAAAPPAPQFALVPASVTNGAFDFTSRQGLAVNTQSMKTLYTDDTRFDVDAQGLHAFLGLLTMRSIVTAWDFDIPIDLDPLTIINGPFVNLLSHHGELSLDHILAFAATYVGQQSRAAQENIQAVQAILNSLSITGYNKVHAYKDAWHINHLPSALALIKVIIREAFIDTNATTRILREKLSSLPAQLALVNGDITKLNSFVMTTMEQLRARGQTTADLVANLFKGYLLADDETFVAYIEKKQEDFDEGNNITYQQLMHLASNKYKILVESGKWRAPSQQDKKILALEAKLAKYESANKAKAAPNPKGGNKSGKGAKDKTKKGTSNKEPLPEWQTTFPGQEFIKKGEPKVVNGKDYWWCFTHKRFTMHKNADCEAAKRDKKKPPAAPIKSALKVSRALQSIVEDDEE